MRIIQKKKLVKLTIRIIMYIFSDYGKNEIVLFPEMIIRELCLNSQCILKTSRVCITVRKIVNLKSPYFSAVFSKSTNFERISLLTDYSTVSAKFNRSRVQTAPVTLLSILQTRQWYQSKELGILLQKHPQHVKIEQFRPEKIEFKD